MAESAGTAVSHGAGEIPWIAVQPGDRGPHDRPRQRLRAPCDRAARPDGTVGDAAFLRDSTKPAALGRIPGVVDGVVTTSFGPDGSVCLHVVPDGPQRGGPADGEHIELVLRPEHADLLGAALLRERRASAPSPRKDGWIPCWLGLRLARRSPE